MGDRWPCGEPVDQFEGFPRQERTERSKLGGVGERGTGALVIATGAQRLVALLAVAFSGRPTGIATTDLSAAEEMIGA